MLPVSAASSHIPLHDLSDPTGTPVTSSLLFLPQTCCEVQVARAQRGTGATHWMEANRDHSPLLGFHEGSSESLRAWLEQMHPLMEEATKLDGSSLPTLTGLFASVWLTEEQISLFHSSEAQVLLITDKETHRPRSHTAAPHLTFTPLFPLKSLKPLPKGAEKLTTPPPSPSRPPVTWITLPPNSFLILGSSAFWEVTDEASIKAIIESHSPKKDPAIHIATALLASLPHPGLGDACEVLVLHMSKEA